MRPERITVTKDIFERLVASNSWRGLEALITWSDSVTWRTKAGKMTVLVIRWKDWVSHVSFPYAYTRAIDDVVIVEVPVEPFFRFTTLPRKWHVNNLR